MFYKDISGCVIITMALPLNTSSVCQGCRLPGILFVIAHAMELVAQRIRLSKDIKVKLTQYAHDTTAFLADVQSISNDLLSLFLKCSGLKINQAKSEMLWLGVHFTDDIELPHKKNIFCRS